MKTESFEDREDDIILQTGKIAGPINEPEQKKKDDRKPEKRTLKNGEMEKALGKLKREGEL